MRGKERRRHNKEEESWSTHLRKRKHVGISEEK
jgi:hypothetical protein